MGTPANSRWEAPMTDSRDLRRQTEATIFNLGYLILVALRWNLHPRIRKDWQPAPPSGNFEGRK